MILSEQTRFLAYRILRETSDKCAFYRAIKQVNTLHGVHGPMRFAPGELYFVVEETKLAQDGGSCWPYKRSLMKKFVKEDQYDPK